MTEPNYELSQLSIADGSSSDSIPEVGLPRRKNKELAPVGFQRSKCALGHVCSNSHCYQHQKNPKILWDKSKYSKPFLPGKIKRQEHLRRQGVKPKKLAAKPFGSGRSEEPSSEVVVRWLLDQIRKSD